MKRWLFLPLGSGLALALASASFAFTSYPSPSCPDTLSVVRLKTLLNTVASCAPQTGPGGAIGDTVLGVGGIIVGFDELSTSYAVYVQQSAGGPNSGIDVFTHTANLRSTYGLNLGDSIVVEYARVSVFNGVLELLSPNNNSANPDLVLRRVNTGHPMPPLFVGNTTDLRESPSNPTFTPYLSALVRLTGPVHVARVGLPYGDAQLGTRGALVVSNTSPGDSVFIDYSRLTNIVPPAVGTVLSSVTGIGGKATRGFRIIPRDAADVVDGQPPAVADGYPVADNQCRIVFDRDVTPASATNTSNYSLASFGTVDNAVMDGASAVVLTVTTGLSHGQSETVTVNGVVSSASGSPMTTPGSATFLSGVLTIAEVQAPEPGALAGSPCVDRSRFAGLGSAPGARMAFRGVATARFGSLYYLEDEAGGTRSGMSLFAPAFTPVLSRRYLVASAVQEFVGETEASGSVYVRDDGVASIPSAIPAAVGVLQDAICDAAQSILTGEDFEGVLVGIDSVRVIEDGPAGGDFHVTDASGADTLVVANGASSYTFDPIPGQILSVTGALTFRSGQFHLQPRGNGDFNLLGTVGTPDPGHSNWPVVVSVGLDGTCCFDVEVKDAAGGGIAGKTVILDFGTYPMAFCPTQPTGVTIVGNTAQATTNLDGIAHICICACPAPGATVSIIAGKVLLDSGVPVANCGPTCSPDTCTAPPKGMIGWWPLDETTVTTVAELTNGMVGSDAMTPKFAPGVVKGSYCFDVSSGSYGTVVDVEIPYAGSPVSYSVGEGDFSIDAWVNHHFYFPQFHPIFCNSYQLGQCGYTFGIDGGQHLQVLMGNSDKAKATYASTGTVPLDEWHHVAVSVRRSSDPLGVFYIDGQEVGTFTPLLGNLGCLYDSPPRPAMIGHAFKGSAATGCPANPDFHGCLDEVEVFNRAISAKDVASIYEAGAKGKCEVSCHAPWAIAFCPNETVKEGVFTICNWGQTERTLTWTLTGLQAGAGCSVDGPTIFSPATDTRTLLPGECIPVTFSVTKPALGPYQSGCFKLTVNDGSTEVCESIGSVWGKPGTDPSCMTAVLPYKYGLFNLVEFRLENVGDLVDSVNYAVAVRPPDQDPNTDLSLNGLPAGTPVVGQLALPAGTTQILSVQANFVSHDPFRTYDVVLSRDYGPSGPVIPVASVAVTSTAPAGAHFLDCNRNGVADASDISSGRSRDGNGDGIPDECQPPACTADGHFYPVETWTQLLGHPSSLPARGQFTATQDPASRKIWVFGGTSTPGNALNDLWSLDVTPQTPTWAVVSPSQPPPPRRLHSAVFDPMGNRILVFGGLDGAGSGALDDLWALSLTGTPTWLPLGTTVPPALAGTLARGAHGAVYDGRNHRMIVYGGRNGSGTCLGDVLALDLPTLTWSSVTPASGGPVGGRASPTAAYDSIGKQMIVYGGDDNSGQAHADAWALSLDPSQGPPSWRALSPSGGPPPARREPMSALDPQAGNLVVFGGLGSSGPLDDLWSLHPFPMPGASWTAIDPLGTPPSARHDGQMVLDEVGRRMFVIGGRDSAGSFRSDVWEVGLPCGPAFIAKDPGAVSAAVDSPATFTVKAGGTPPLTFQWRKNGTRIPGATLSTYTISSALRADVAQYDCMVANGCGSVVSAGAPLSVGCAPMPANVVAWWKLDGNAVDQTHAHEGAVTGSGGSFVPGEVGQGFRPVPGSNVTVPHAPSLNLDEFTIQSWVKLDSIPATNPAVVWKGNNAGQAITSPFGLGIYGSTESPPLAGRPFLTIGNGSSYQELDAASAVPVGQWIHLAATADGSTLRLYVNGSLSASAPEGVAPGGSSHPVQIGGVIAPPGNWFTGVLDELSLSSSAATAEQIRAVYEAGGSGECSGVVSVEPQPASTALSLSAGPNPSPHGFTVAFSVPRPTFARLGVYDAAGRLVARLVDGRVVTGRQTLVWSGMDRSGSPAPNGVYFVRLSAGGESRSARIVLIR